jgi:hypothetical protein
MKRLATWVLVACALIPLACTSAKGTPPPPAPDVVLWGDSFGESVAPHLVGSGYEVRAYGGTAPCDWLEDIARVASTRPPAVAVLVFVGNTVTRCTGGTTAGYGVDMVRATAILRAAGSRVVIVAAPPFGGGPSPNPVNAAYMFASATGARIAWAPSESVAPGGIYAQAYRDPDGVHLNAAGALRFAQAIRQEIG